MKHERKSKRKGKTCDVKGCDNSKKASVPGGKVTKKTDLKVNPSSAAGNAYLCKKHYKEYKKATKEEREMRQLGWD
ncbi:MAG: hypothetical protein R6W73_02850 [Candidatus Saliniplasma sp.]